MPYVGAANVPGRGIDQLDTATNTAGPSAALQAATAYLRSRGQQPTADNIRRAIEQNARDPGAAGADPIAGLRNAMPPMDVLPAKAERSGGGRSSGSPTTSAAPASATPTPGGMSAADLESQLEGQPTAGATGGGTGGIPSWLAALAPAIAGGVPLAAILGRQYFDSRTGLPSPAGAAPIEPVPGGGLRIPPTGPGFDPEYGPPRGSPSGPGFDAEYGGRAPTSLETPRGPGFDAEYAPRTVPPAAPTQAAPAQPAAPVESPTGAGFEPEYSPAKAAIDKALEKPTTLRAEPTTGRGRGGGRGAPGKSAPARRIPLPIPRA